METEKSDGKRRETTYEGRGRMWEKEKEWVCMCEKERASERTREREMDRER